MPSSTSRGPTTSTPGWRRTDHRSRGPRVGADARTSGVALRSTSPKGEPGHEALAAERSRDASISAVFNSHSSKGKAWSQGIGAWLDGLVGDELTAVGSKARFMVEEKS